MKELTQTRQSSTSGLDEDKEALNKYLTESQEQAKENSDGLDVVGADLHFDEVVEAARDGGVDVVLTIYELERYMDAQDRREEAYNVV